jgi:cytochrome P450
MGPTGNIHDVLAGFSTEGKSLQEVRAIFERARAECPVARSNELGGFWVLVEYADVKQCHRDWKTFSSLPSVKRPVIDAPRLPPLEYDPPAHTAWRKVISRAFNATTPRTLEEVLRGDVVALIDKISDSDSCDLFVEFGAEVPVLGMCRLLGLDPEKGHVIRELIAEMSRSIGDPEKLPAVLAAAAEVGMGELNDRRENPRDDVLTDLLSADLDGRPLTDEELTVAVLTFIVGGHETTVSSLASLLYEVLSRPEVKQRLIDDPSLIPNAVEEALRLRPPFVGFYRRATREAVINGVSIPEGDSVYLNWTAANRDPKVFENPDDFDVDRPARSNRHMSFGHGIHVCPGAQTSRMVLRVAVEELLSRLPDIELIDPGSIEYTNVAYDNFILESLPVRFTPPRG